MLNCYCNKERLRISILFVCLRMSGMENKDSKYRHYNALVTGIHFVSVTTWKAIWTSDWHRSEWTDQQVCSKVWITDFCNYVCKTIVFDKASGRARICFEVCECTEHEHECGCVFVLWVWMLVWVGGEGKSGNSHLWHYTSNPMRNLSFRKQLGYDLVYLG
jgi:hypothetical protein